MKWVFCALSWGIGCTIVQPEPVPYRFRQTLLAPSGDAPHSGPTPPNGKRHRDRSWRKTIVRRAKTAIGRRFEGNLRRATLRFLSAVYGVRDATPMLQAAADSARATPTGPGDLAYFRSDEPPIARRGAAVSARGKTPVALPPSTAVLPLSATVAVVIDRAGPRVSFVYLLDGRARRGYLSLAAPGQRHGGGQVANTYLRPIGRSDPPKTDYLAGRLLAGFTPPPRP